jgi:hypothetical protein
MTVLIAFLGVRGTVVAGLLTALLLAVGGWGGWQWLRAERAVVAEGMAKSAEALANTGLTTCLQANESATFTEDARRRMAAANAEALAAALERARGAVAEARKQREASDRLLAEWRKTWGDKSATCAAALQTLDTACPELRRY